MKSYKLKPKSGKKARTIFRCGVCKICGSGGEITPLNECRCCHGKRLLAELEYVVAVTMNRREVFEGREVQD